MTDARTASRILIAEDSHTQAKRAQLVLEEAGFQVTVAVDGEAAWEVLRQDTIDMVVSDIDMPRLDGFGLCVRVKADPRLAQIPFVLLTGRMDLEALVRGLEVGADDVINKTWVPSLLVARLTALLRGRRPAAGGTGSRERLLELILSRTIELEDAYRALDEERRRAA
jgi:DNA-binding response OmpR family regulator